MSIGKKIADGMPASWVEYLHEHPRAVYAVTIPLIAIVGYNLLKAFHVHAMAEQFVAQVQRARSEALGG